MRVVLSVLLIVIGGCGGMLHQKKMPKEGEPDSANLEDYQNLRIKGTVISDEGVALSGVKVEATNSKNVSQIVFTGASGSFTTYLDYDEKFMVKFSVDGFKSKKLIVNTFNIPKEKRGRGFKYFGFKVIMERAIGQTEKADAPKHRIFYNPKLNEFVDEVIW